MDLPGVAMVIRAGTVRTELAVRLADAADSLPAMLTPHETPLRRPGTRPRR